MSEQIRNHYTDDAVAGAFPKEAEKEIDLIELLYKLLEKFRYIVLSALLCALIAGVYAFFLAVPKYQATAKLYVMNSKDSALNLSDLQIGSYLTTDYQEVFKTWEVHEMVKAELNLPYTYKQMEEMLSVTNPPSTRILNVSAISKDPVEATNVANTYAKVAKRYISMTMATDEPNILSIALQPTRPISPNKTMYVMVGFFLGAMLAVGIITLLFVLDDKIKTADDIQKYAGLATISVVPRMNMAPNKKRDKGTQTEDSRRKKGRGAEV